VLLFCAVSVEFRNWKPIPLDSVTDDLSATVEQILGSLASFITVRIRLTRCLVTYSVRRPRRTSPARSSYYCAIVELLIKTKVQDWNYLKFVQINMLN